MSLAPLVTQVARRLEAARLSYGHGTTCAWDEAAWLVLHALGQPLDSSLDDSAPPPRISALKKVATLMRARIATRTPLAYLLREAWLQGVSFYVDERCIIPRSLLAEVIADASADPWLPAECRRVLDLCCGGGSLAVLAALAWPEMQVDAADISAEALEIARINVERHGLQERIRLLQGDGLAACAGERYGLILCNPPYVNAESMASLPPEYAAEPPLALAGGADGMDFIRPLLARAAEHLTEGGVLLLEIGNEREHFEAAFPQLSPVWLPTSAGCEQVLLLTRDELLQ